MTDIHKSGPDITWGYIPGAGGDYNPDAGPDTHYQGDCFMDPSYPYQGGAGTIVSGSVERATFYNTQSIRGIDAIPTALATNNISASAAISSTAISLVTATGSGIVVTTVGSVMAGYPAGFLAPGLQATNRTAPSTALLAIEQAFAYLVVGRNAILDPTKSLARNLRFASTSNIATVTFTVRGYDIYGVKMTEQVTGVNNSTVSGLKAWKYIQSITASTTSASSIAVGTGDVYGFPIRCDKWEDLLPFYIGAFVTTSTGFTAAVTATPSATTGDVRGTWALTGGASNGTNRLAITINPPLSTMINATFNSPAPLKGQPQYSDF